MTFSSRNTIIGAIIVIVILVLGYFAWKEREGSTQGSGLAASSTVATTTPPASAPGSGITISLVGGSTGSNAAPTTLPQPIPNLDRPVAGNSADPSLTPEVLTDIRARVASTSVWLKVHPRDVGQWAALGIYRKQGDDYQGAREAWSYALRLNPNDPIMLANLGDLYGFFLGNPAQAVTYYKQAIAADSSREGYYESLYQVYYMLLHDTPHARATLQQGIDAKVEGYQNLQQLLNQLPVA